MGRGSGDRRAATEGPTVPKQFKGGGTVVSVKDDWTTVFADPPA
jgi:hypothetical protein